MQNNDRLKLLVSIGQEMSCNQITYFWRDQSGREIDIIAEWSGKIFAIEVKNAMTFRPAFIKQLDYFAKLVPNETCCYIAYAGESAGSFKNTRLVPFANIQDLWLQ